MADQTRIGIVDMGSNAIRFAVAEATAGTIGLLESHRLPVRLGRDVFHTGQIPEPTLADIVDAFRRFRATCDRLGVLHIRAIATSAMRDARNRELLVDRVRDACGIESLASTSDAITISPPPSPNTPNPGNTKISIARQTTPPRNNMISSAFAVPCRYCAQK